MLRHINTKHNYSYTTNINGLQRFCIQSTGIPMLPVYFQYLTPLNSFPHSLFIIDFPQEKNIWIPSLLFLLQNLIHPLLPHYNFLTCLSCSSNKHPRLKCITITLSTLHTHLMLPTHILLSLSQLYNNDLCPSKYSLSSSIYALSDIYQSIHSQSLIGWHHFIRGRTSTFFRPIIHNCTVNLSCLYFKLILLLEIIFARIYINLLQKKFNLLPKNHL